MADFGTRLKELRQEQGLTQQELADKIKVHDPHGMHGMSISGYERGMRKPSFEVLDALADILNVNLDYLLGNTDIRLPYPQHAQEMLEATMPKPFRLRLAEQRAKKEQKHQLLIRAYDDAEPAIKLAVRKLLNIPEELTDGDC